MTTIAKYLVMDAIIKYEVDACGGKGFLTMKWKPIPLHLTLKETFSSRKI